MCAKTYSGADRCPVCGDTIDEPFAICPECGWEDEGFIVVRYPFTKFGANKHCYFVHKLLYKLCKYK